MVGKKKLVKVVTRFFRPITLQAWFFGSTTRLNEGICVSFNVIFWFDGRKVEAFRLAEEIEGNVKEAVLDFAVSNAFLNGFKDYEELVKQYGALLLGDSLTQVFEHCARLYPFFAVSYYTSNYWSNELPLEKKEKVIELCDK